MRKLKVILLLFLCLFIKINVTKAAFAYNWTINGEVVGESNINGAKWWYSEKDEHYVLTLTNYNGGPIELECGGTGLNIPFYIELIGENNINAQNGIGIILPHDLEVIFIGNGFINIDSSLSIGVNNTEIDLNDSKKTVFYGNDYKNETLKENQQSNKEKYDQNKQVDVVSKEKLDENNKLGDNSFKLNAIDYILLSICGILLIAVIILSLKLSSISKSIK